MTNALRLSEDNNRAPAWNSSFIPITSQGLGWSWRLHASTHNPLHAQTYTNKYAHAPLGFACTLAFFFEAMVKVASVTTAQVPERQAELLGVTEKEKIGISAPAS